MRQRTACYQSYSIQQCIAMCDRRRERCKAFTYKRTRPTCCYLWDSNRSTPGTRLEYKPSHDYYEKRALAPGGRGLRNSHSFCDLYAKQAVSSAKWNVRQRCGFSGARWGANYSSHYNWCRRVPIRTVNKERNARQNLQRQCIQRRTTGRRPPPPPRPPTGGSTQRFNHPRINGAVVDGCAPWGKNCGWGAAHYYCKSRGFARATSWRTDYRGRTWVQITNKFCTNNTCGGFSQLVCAGRSTGQRPSRDVLGRVWNEMEVAGWRGVWTRIGNSNDFNARFSHPNGQRLNARLRMTVNGRGLRIDRWSSAARCVYQGTFSANYATVSGTYVCTLLPARQRLPAYSWSARISR